MMKLIDHFSGIDFKIKITLLYLLVAALLGLSLRFIQVGVISANYKHMLHTHSHIALLGWLYNAVVIILQYVIFKKNESRFNALFWITQTTFLGMMFSFPFQGYAFWSITFSTLYLFCSYVLVFYMFQESKAETNIAVKRLIRWAAVFLVLSSVGPWALGIIMAKGLAHTFWYKLSIYWFLHFLYNGFFVLILFALFINNVNSTLTQNRISKLMCYSVIPLYGLSVLWLSPSLSYYVVSAIAVMLQLVAFILLLRGSVLDFNVKQKQLKILFWLAITAYALKVVFQLIAVIPSIQSFLLDTVAYSVIGFIHLVMLGFFTLLLLFILLDKLTFKVNLWIKSGLLILTTGVIFSELLLFGQSLIVYFQFQVVIPYYPILTGVSSLMPLGIGLVLLFICTQKENSKYHGLP